MPGHVTSGHDCRAVNLPNDRGHGHGSVLVQGDLPAGLNGRPAGGGEQKSIPGGLPLSLDKAVEQSRATPPVDVQTPPMADMRAFQAAVTRWARGGPDGPARDLAESLGVRTAVLLEGLSDLAAVEALASGVAGIWPPRECVSYRWAGR